MIHYRYSLFSAITLLIVGFFTANSAHATFIGCDSFSGANSCTKTTNPPNPVTQDPNDGILLVWDERQNLTLGSDLPVDRVADPTASFVGGSAGSYFIKAGTVVSSHYVQWDPGNNSSATVIARLAFDSNIFAFITADGKLSGSDSILGLPGLNYNTFTNRGLESGDTTVYPFAPTDFTRVDINWTASSPGDWTRLITAYSPAGGGGRVPEPATWALMGLGLVGLALRRRHKI